MYNTRYYGLHGALLLIIMSVVISQQTQSLVWSQRAVCTVLFLMAELYRCPSAIDDVREGVIVCVGFALPSVCMGCTIHCLLCANIWENSPVPGCQNLPGVHMLGLKPSPPRPLPYRPFPSWFRSHVRACRGWKCSAVESSLIRGPGEAMGVVVCLAARMGG